MVCEMKAPRYSMAEAKLVFHRANRNFISLNMVIRRLLPAGVCRG